jgi:hypothetical protein
VTAGYAAAIREEPPDDWAPNVEWPDFIEFVLDWRQNQHLACVGPTEQGKTNLVYQLLLAYRQFVAFLATKPRDKVLDAFGEAGGYQRIQEWPPKRGWPIRRAVSARDMPRRLVWPDATRLDAEGRQREVFGRALDNIYVEGGWCTVFDDYWYLSHILGLERTSKKMLMNARSNDIPFVLCAQRPAGNRLVEIFDQSTHLFFARDNDEANLKRIGQVGWLDSSLIRSYVAHLEPYQFLYVNSRTGHMYRTRAPELTL